MQAWLSRLFLGGLIALLYGAGAYGCEEELIREHHPVSLAELAELSGRKKSNLSRTLKTMEHYGLVSLKEGPRGSIIPRVPYSRIELNLNFANGNETAKPLRKSGIDINHRKTPSESVSFNDSGVVDFREETNNDAQS